VPCMDTACQDAVIGENPGCDKYVGGGEEGCCECVWYARRKAAHGRTDIRVGTGMWACA